MTKEEQKLIIQAYRCLGRVVDACEYKECCEDCKHFSPQKMVAFRSEYNGLGLCKCPVDKWCIVSGDDHCNEFASG